MTKEKKETIFRPELSLEWYLSAKHKRSKLTIQDTDDAIVILEGIKELTTNHSVLIYLDSNDVVVEIESFINAVDKFGAVEATRALAGVIYKQNKDQMIKVLLARTMPDIDVPTPEHIDIKKLANFAIRLHWIEVELVDVILIGSKGHFSFRNNKEGWAQYTKELGIRKELTMDGPFFPDVVKMPDEKS